MASTFSRPTFVKASMGYYIIVKCVTQIFTCTLMSKVPLLKRHIPLSSMAKEMYIELNFTPSGHCLVLYILYHTFAGSRKVGGKVRTHILLPTVLFMVIVH